MKRCGFTLVELLVVLAIIGVLASLLMSALTGARDQARSVTCMSNLRSLGTGFAAYATNLRGHLCSGQADARPGMNYDITLTDLQRTGIERVGWIADLVNGGFAFPGRMLCPSNPGTITQSWGRALTLPGAAGHYTPQRFGRLFEDYNSNYCQSWYMAHTQYDGTTTAALDADGRLGAIGPLRMSDMSAAGAERVPLLGDARSARDEWFDHQAQGYGPAGRETKSVTDGPGWRLDRDDEGQVIYVMASYAAQHPYGIQDWDDFGPAHGWKSTMHDEEHGFTKGNLLFGDMHAESFEDRYDFDNGEVSVGPDGELDSWDLRESVFDGVLSLGRRSQSVERLE